MEPPIQFTVRQILDYYGKCPRCGYPAGAAETIQSFADDRVAATVVATCELPCGWHGPVTPTTMTAVTAMS